MPKVYLPHVPTRYDPLLDQRVPTVNLSPAAKYGDVVQMTDMRGRIGKESLDDAIDEIFDMAQGMAPGDFIACIGDPLLITAAIHYACEKLGTIKVLRWDKNLNDYIELEISF